jgi:transcriptional regulator with XRE-family HTH domain
VTPADFRAALGRLGWTQTEAAKRLGVSGQPRISRWARGVRPVPPYIVKSVRAHLELDRLRRELHRLQTENTTP